MSLSIKKTKNSIPIAVVVQPKTKWKDMVKIYLDSENENGKQEVNLSIDSIAEIIPLPLKYKKSNHNNRVYISGQSGSGKSTFTAKYIKYAEHILKPKEFYLFSRVPEDKPLDALDPNRIITDKKLLLDPYTTEDLEKSIVLFDDVDTISNKFVKKYIQDLRADILEVGRHYDVNIISTSHMLMNGAETKKLINEATMVVIFPRTLSSYHRNRFYQVYQGLSKKQIEEIDKIKSRWIAMTRGARSLLTWEKGVRILK